MYRVCKKMKIAAVQQGIVQKDPDVDAIYRLLNADPVTGLDERFNQFAPPVTLAPGTYAPWNSQNTLFHRRAFFGLFLPTSVAFRVTDIWRSFFTQKLLHIIDEAVSFVPVNAIQIRNAHDYLKDFHQEIDVYEKTGELINFIDGWKCQYKGTVEGCVLELAKEFALRGFWSTEDHRLITMWIEDLKSVGYTFPPLREPSDEYNTVFINGSNDNCRPAHIELKLDTLLNLNESVDYACTSKELEAHFKDCGVIARTTIQLDKFTGEPKGFAYIEFTDIESMGNALALHGSLLRGRPIKSWKREQTSRAYRRRIEEAIEVVAE